MEGSTFFRLGRMNQSVNSFLCMVLLASMCWWTLVYFFVHIGDSLSGVELTISTENRQLQQVQIPQKP